MQIAPVLGSTTTWTDSDIDYWLREALRTSPHHASSNISHQALQGIVTLTGTADHIAARRNAVLVAQKIKGVRGVIDRIEIRDDGIEDIEIVALIRTHLLNHSSIGPQRIDIVAQNGVVTLTGDVSSWAQQHLASLLTSEVPSVKAVNNLIHAVTGAWPTDAEIKKDAEAILARKAYLTGLYIHVEVDDGIIYLKGVVGSDSEKERAQNNVLRLSPIGEVRNFLKVESWALKGSREQIEWPSAEALEQAIRDVIAQDPRIEPTEITILVSRPNVTLEGEVPDLSQKTRIEDDVRHIVGVSIVTNNLFVTAEEREDLEIYEDVKFNLASEHDIAEGDLHAVVKYGVVTLSGFTATQVKKAYAGDSARHVRGVRKVVNDIVVRRHSSPKTSTLLLAIETALQSNWTTMGIVEQIDLAVKDSVVTLKGEVDT
jgi:osmotically-inducible protein OsmY